VGRQTTNYKKRALVQLDKLKSDLSDCFETEITQEQTLKRLNKIKSTIEKIREPQTSHAIKKQNKPVSK